MLGFSQVYGIDYEETFAPTVRYDMLRLLFAIIAIEDLEMHQMDVISAYLVGNLNEEIYMHPSEGYDTGEGKYYHLRKSIYSFKQAAQVWNYLLTEFLKKLGF